jgi:hypothetical protein
MVAADFKSVSTKEVDMWFRSLLTSWKSGVIESGAEGKSLRASEKRLPGSPYILIGGHAMRLQLEEAGNCSPAEAIHHEVRLGWWVQARHAWRQFLTALLRSLAVGQA